jgi:hypothetical protein
VNLKLQPLHQSVIDLERQLQSLLAMKEEGTTRWAGMTVVQAIRETREAGTKDCDHGLVVANDLLDTGMAQWFVDKRRVFTPVT